MDNPDLPKLVKIPLAMQKRFGRGFMLVPSPREVDALIRTVPSGGLTTTTEIRSKLAAEHSADTTCPLTTGIFVRIAAEAAEEDAREGRRPVTPYWRVVKDDGSLNPKFPGGFESQAAKLCEEGHRILPGRGNRPPRVADLPPSRSAQR